jgi:hypothetical protein
MWPFRRKQAQPEQPPQLFWNPTLCVRRFPDGSVKQWGILAPHEGWMVIGKCDPDTFVLPAGFSGEWRELDLQLEPTRYWTHVIVPKVAYDEIERLRSLMQGWSSYAWKDGKYVDDVQEFFNQHLGNT